MQRPCRLRTAASTSSYPSRCSTTSPTGSGPWLRPCGCCVPAGRWSAMTCRGSGNWRPNCAGFRLTVCARDVPWEAFFSGSRSLSEAADQEVRPHRALALDVYLAPTFELMGRQQATIGFLRYLDPSRNTTRLHPAGGVDGIAPDIVCKSVTPDHGCHRWAAIDTDPKADRPSA